MEGFQSLFSEEWHTYTQGLPRLHYQGKHQFTSLMRIAFHIKWDGASSSYQGKDFHVC